MGKQEDQLPMERKPRFLCLHGFRTSGEILKKQIGRWPQSVLGLENLDLVFLNAPFPSTGKSDVEGFFDPPYYEWYQLDKGVALTKVPKIKFLVIIGGAKLKEPSLAKKAYSSPIRCPSVHFLGETDYIKPYGIELLKSVVYPVVIDHPKGHTVPRLDDKSLPIMPNFIESIQKAVAGNE